MIDPAKSEIFKYEFIDRNAPFSVARTIAGLTSEQATFLGRRLLGYKRYERRRALDARRLAVLDKEKRRSYTKRLMDKLEEIMEEAVPEAQSCLLNLRPF